MSDRSRSRSPEPAAAPAPAADASNGDAPAVQTASSETTGEEVKLYLGNLSYDTDEARIQEKFREAGTVNEVFLPIDRQTQRVRGFGFCTMANRSDAEKAIQMFDGSDLDGRMIKVNESKPKGQGGPGGQGSFNSSGAAEVKLYVGNLSFETTKESLEEVSSCCLFLALVVCFSLLLFVSRSCCLFLALVVCFSLLLFVSRSSFAFLAPSFSHSFFFSSSSHSLIKKHKNKNTSALNTAFPTVWNRC